ncbi:ribonuclease P protein component [Cytophagaceae bacterium ABcell3]|nr:ribonuclease P protein component [Cytophagaceae bacterium ABcell3]
MTVAEQHEDRIRFTLPKNERLSSKKIIEELFKKGSSCFLYPFKIVYLDKEDVSEKQPFPQVLFTISRKNFRKATDRNKIRRKVKEAYRLNKPFIFGKDKNKVPDYLAIIYVAKEVLPFKEVERKLILILQRLKN